MRLLNLTPALIIFVLLFSSCSSENTCTKNGNYNIEYYSGGGFTGFEKGIIIGCDGKATLWERKSGQSREYYDSLKLSSDQLTTFDKLIQSPDLFNYQNDYSGNFTAHLNILKDDKINKISFDPSEIPSDMPDAVRELITEIKNIYKK